MHNNVWSMIYLLSVPAGLTLLVGLIRWVVRRRFPKKTLMISFIFALLPTYALIAHIRSEKRQMSKVQGRYKVIKAARMEELCTASDVMDLELTLFESGKYAFNKKPCFADRKEGKWRWQDDLVGSYAVFEIEINHNAYLEFDIQDTLKLINRDKEYLIFARHPTHTSTFE